MTTVELPLPDEAGFTRAHETLMRAFAPLRVRYAWIDGPFGRVFVARSQRGVCRVSFRRSEDVLLTDLERRGLLPERARGELDSELRQLEEYFEGKRRRFRFPVDLRGVTPFQRKVLEAASEIPFGRVERYADVAERVGSPKACRAVGNALGKNPVAIVIPCHRVVASGGKLGGYTGGLDIKRTLMRIEGIPTGEGKR